MMDGLYCAMRFDASLSDCARAIASVFKPTTNDQALKRLEKIWCPDGKGFAALSVRSGLDALLTSMNWPKGTRILTSAITIPDVPKILRAHGLVPIAIDIDPDTLAPKLELMKKAMNSDTKAVLVAHIYGTRFPMDEYIAFAKQHQLLLIEDCAEGFAGPSFQGHPESDVTMFSFGPIKFSTAWQGALFRVKNSQILDKMNKIQSTFPYQSRWSYFCRSVKFALMWVGLKPIVYWLLCTFVKTFITKNHHQFLVPFLRSFSGPEAEYFKRLRFRPSVPLLNMLASRLTTFSSDAFDMNRKNGKMMVDLLPQSVYVPGWKSEIHNFWLFPIMVRDKKKLVETLQEQGVDASMGTTQLVAVNSDVPDAPPIPNATHLMTNICYLPITDRVPASLIRKIAKIVAGETAGTYPLPFPN